MLNKKEMLWILIIGFILSISISIISTWQVFFLTILSIFLILIINIAAKKAIAFYVDSQIEVFPWEIKRYGFRPGQQLKHNFPAGILLPIIVSALSLGNLIWMASLVFEVKPKVYRSAKRHGIYSYSEITESQIGLIAAAGIFANLVFAVFGYLIGWPIFTQLSIWYAFFNMLPISDLDGNKIFFGNLVLWSFLASIVIIAIGYALLLI